MKKPVSSQVSQLTFIGCTVDPDLTGQDGLVQQPDHLSGQIHLVLPVVPLPDQLFTLQLLNRPPDGGSRLLAGNLDWERVLSYTGLTLNLHGL